MKVTYNWLRDFVDIKLRPEDLAEKLTLAGLEVTAFGKFGQDTVFEIEVTPNRVDCLSVIGIAREVAAITGKKLRSPQVKTLRPTKVSPGQTFSVKIIDKKGCPYYTARLIKDIKVRPSPAWLTQRLEAVGTRPVNNVVDITNYCLMQTGQPLHAFDYDKLISQYASKPASQLEDIEDIEIIIRRSRKGESIQTIDGEQRRLDESVLIIAAGAKGESSRAVAIAGIMGGMATEVTSSTQNILLESAYFDPIIIRRASRLLGLASESSYRFERGLDSAAVLSSSDRALELISQLCAGRLQNQKLAGKPPTVSTRKITFSISQANKFLGTQITPIQAKRILAGLGFKLTGSKHKFSLQVPSFRRDIQSSTDLSEEIARLYGYDKIPVSLPYIRVSKLSAASEPLRKQVGFIRKILIGLGLNEIISYSLFSQEVLSRLGNSVTQAVRIRNPLTRDQQIMRPTLIDGLLRCLAKNLSQRLDTIKVFECDKVYLPDALRDYPIEQVNLGILIAGQTKNSWLRKSSKLTLFDLKGLIQTLGLRLGIPEDSISFEPGDCLYLARGRSVSINVAAKHRVGFMGQVDAKILSAYDIDDREVFLAEIQVENLAKYINLAKKYIPSSIYPSIKRDLSVLVPSALAQEEIARIIKQEARDFVSKIRVSEQYLGTQIPPGFRGLSFQLEYQSPTRTLTDAEVDDIQKRIVERLKEKLNLQIR